ncbi:MAG: septal ring lytic transglycosylase RlpA family protein [Spirochaetes bacterium]|nr:septal ring lytic transglycosylase RlpA family protein [Spirochaetota bacterium]
MRKFFVVVVAIALVITFFTSCAPNNVMTKRDETYTFDQSNVQEKPVYSDMDSPQVASNSDSSYYQVGIASWYGREFQGRLTASGQPFDMNKYTAAHRTLPFGSVIVVTNLENGKKVKCTVNDRGPFKKNRILDVSYAAARQLDMLTKGEAKVGITVLSYGNETQQQPPSNDVGVFGEPVNPYNENQTNSLQDSNDYIGIALQTGAFYSKANALKLKEKIETIIDKPVTVVQEGYYYKVRIINLNDSDVVHYKNILKKNDIPSYKVTIGQ